MYVTVDDESDKGIAPVVRIKSVGALHPSFFFILLSLYSATLYFTIANSSGLRSERRNKLSRFRVEFGPLYQRDVLEFSRLEGTTNSDRFIIYRDQETGE